jgi:hypothetical protein
MFSLRCGDDGVGRDPSEAGGAQGVTNPAVGALMFAEFYVGLHLFQAETIFTYHTSGSLFRVICSGSSVLLRNESP